MIIKNYEIETSDYPYKYYTSHRKMISKTEIYYNSVTFKGGFTTMWDMGGG